MGVYLRVDLFLKLMGITKTRMAAKRLCDKGMVQISGKALKPSHEVATGETLDVLFPLKEMKLKVLEIPVGKSVAKSDRPRYMGLFTVKEL